MNSEQNANPADDEEIIELTDVVKPGPDAEEAIVDLTDVVETVKAEPLDTALAQDEELPLELEENAILDDGTTDTLVDLTESLDSPGVTASDNVSDDAEALLDLNDAADDDMLLDLQDALETEGIADATDDVDTASEIAAEIEVDPEVLDLAEVLDAPETDGDPSALDSPADNVALTEDVSGADSPVFEDTLEVIEAEPVEAPLDELDGSLDDEAFANLDLDDMVEIDDVSEEISDDSDADADDILDLGQPVEPAAAVTPAEAQGPLVGAGDTGDDLEFKLDEMLAEAQAEMPDLDDDGADMELDLSEALADAAAGIDGEDSSEVLDLSDPVAPATDALVDGDADEFDLISEDKVIDLDVPVAADSPTEKASTHDNVIELADVTGGYPTVSPATEFDSDAAEADASEEDLPTEAEPVLEDVFLEADDTDNSLDEEMPPSDTEPPEDEDLDIGVTLDGEEAAEEDEDFQLNPEMEKLEATLDDVFQDDGDDLEAFAEAVDEGADESENETTEAPAAEVVPVGLVDSEATAGATEASVGNLPPEITEAALDAAMTRVIKTMYADRIEQMILDVIKEAVTAEIEKVKKSLGDQS